MLASTPPMHHWSEMMIETLPKLNNGCVHTVALPFTLKKSINAKDEL
jgi:hypothetical protein